MLEVSHLTVGYGKTRIINDISFSAKEGEVTCLIGLNGTGKTTILNAIMNLIPRTTGEVHLDGKPLTVKRFNEITMIPDHLMLLPEQTINDALEVMSFFYESWEEQRAADLLKFFRLKPSQVISTLSKGNMSKLNLVLGLGLDSKFVLMDEPFSGIDVFSREEITQVFSTDLVSGKGVLLTTHDINDIEVIADRVIMLENGEIIKDFYTEAIREKEGMSIIDVMREVYQRERI